jgi:hypothetical protein
MVQRESGFRQELRPSLQAGGLYRINDHFSLLSAYFMSLFRDRYEKLGGSSPSEMLTGDDPEILAAKQSADA